MNSTRGYWWTAGVIAGTLAVSTTLLSRRGRLQRAALAEHIDTVTQHAVNQLHVPAESKFITVNGLQLHTVIAGPRDGPLIVLLHGFPECWYTWRNQIAPLVQAGYRVVVPDQRGYNLSDKPSGIHPYRLDALSADVRELIRSFGRDTAIVVGHDVGGLVAWHLAMHHPEVVDKLIIMNAPHPAAYLREIRANPAQQHKSWYVGFFQMPWLPEELIGYAPLASANLFFRKQAVNQNAFSSFDLHVMATALAQPEALTNMINWYRASVRYRSSFANIRPIAAPTLLIWAEEDKALGKSLTYGLETWVRHLKIHYIPHCGHWAQNEAPDEVNAEMLTFLQQKSM